MKAAALIFSLAIAAINVQRASQPKPDPAPPLSAARQALAWQAACASDAARVLVSMGWKAEAPGYSSDFKTHFNAKLKKCFVLESSYLLNEDFRVIEL
ncbi:MAG TPA: hypothetical protein VNE16_04755, partial [Vicinamibacterales bacterium]|nr:hypothetical protein [Vicinamibacterales bacterium]